MMGMSNTTCIYGVDISGKITPIQVRDAIVRCFSLAQEELKQTMRKNMNIKPEQIEKVFVDYLIENAFNEADGDFNHPTKEILIQVVNRLKKYATDAFRDPAIIEKHTDEIMQLIDKLE